MLEFLGLVLVGAVAGYLAGLLFKGKGFGTAGNMIIGILGALLGAVVLAFLGGLLIKLFMAFVGAVILFWAISKFRREKPSVDERLEGLTKD